MSLDAYEDGRNPDGVIELAYAENRLLLDFWRPRLQSCAPTTATTRYGIQQGSRDCRAAFLELLSVISGIDRRQLDASNLTMTSGCDAAFDLLVHSLCQPGQVVGIVTPTHPGAMRCIRCRGVLDTIEIAVDLGKSVDALLSCLNANPSIAALVLCNPTTPTGQLWTRSDLEKVVEHTRGIHVIVDEVLAVSLHSWPNSKFCSALRYAHSNDHVHVVTGLSKAGLAGLHVGAVYTRHQSSTFSSLSTLTQISNPTQEFIAKAFHDRDTPAALMECASKRLTAAYRLICNELHRHRINAHVVADAGLTIMVELNTNDGHDDDGALVNDILTQAKVMVHPGSRFSYPGHRWVRVVFADQPDVIREGVRRLASFVKEQYPRAMSTKTEAALQKAWARSDQVFSFLSADGFLLRPITLRHPFLFYVGHLPAFAMNQVALALGKLAPVRANASFDALFERGMDPDVLTGECHAHSADANNDVWPAIDDVVKYACDTRQRILGCVEVLLEMRLGYVVDIIIEHEQMHQETLLYMMMQCDPVHLSRPESLRERPLTPMHKASCEPVQCTIPGGKAVLGMSRCATTFGWDNEFPQVSVDVGAFRVQRLPVTNAEYLEWVDGGAYTVESNWPPDVWRWIVRDQIRHPALWRYDDVSKQWMVRTLFEYVPLSEVADHPVFVSNAEADAYCRSHGGRLMTEPEYHRAAYGDTCHPFPWGNDAPEQAGVNVDFRHWGTQPVWQSNSASPFGVRDLIGNGWEWTSSQFMPLGDPLQFTPMPSYPGYSADFFDGKHYVMKGGSWATATNMTRPSFRNWYQKNYVYPFAKFRICRDIEADERDASVGTSYRFVTLPGWNKQSLEGRFARDVRAGLSSNPKRIDSMHFYDDRGSELFAMITETEEYYLTRTETRILQDHAPTIAAVLTLLPNPSSINLIEIGAGDGKKTIPLLQALRSRGIQLSYTAIDISQGALDALQGALRSSAVDVTDATFLLGDNVEALRWTTQVDRPGMSNVVLFLGSSIGNYDNDKAEALLHDLRDALNVGDLLIVGFDLVKENHSIMIDAYSDAAGVTAEFNYNLLDRVNRELGGDFDRIRFEHQALFNPVHNRMESHLVASQDLVVSIDGDEDGQRLAVPFRARETIHIENSYKYELGQIETFAGKVGLHVVHHFLDDKSWFTDTCFQVVSK
ncbi:Histidine-specific methyltransferase SAM-dependent domain-containing protein [Plasmodiophora brassicae]|nr:hypothetical protein PBRA_006261 [Plasmodiophora brassicae]